jgi:hypothetical protein
MDAADVYLNCPSEPKLFGKQLLKEVIQPQVPLRLPCYDFTPVADLAVGAPLTRLGTRLRARSTPMV